jgi:hypothetical protein
MEKESLWQIEDDIRACENAGDFGVHFIELARSDYGNNDCRAALKRMIYERLGAEIVEGKSYVAVSGEERPPASLSGCRGVAAETE